MNDTVGKRIDKVLQDIQARKNVNYACRQEVCCYNRAYDRIVRNIRYIDKHYPDQIGRLLVLLNSSDVDIITHIAPIVLQLNNCPFEDKLTAFRILEGLLEDQRLDKLDKLVLSVNIPKWRAELLTTDTKEDVSSVHLISNRPK